MRAAAALSSSPVLVYCLQLQFLWNGAALTAGRLPFYGTEVPNVSYERGHQPRETVLFRLDPEPVAYLSESSVHVWFAEPLPATPGKLEVRAALAPCKDPAVAAQARFRTPAALQDWTVELRAGPSLAAPVKGRLTPRSAFVAALELGQAGAGASAGEQFELDLVSRDGQATIGVDWNRWVAPGRPEIRLRRHRPGEPP